MLGRRRLSAYGAKEPLTKGRSWRITDTSTSSRPAPRGSLFVFWRHIRLGRVACGPIQRRKQHDLCRLSFARCESQVPAPPWAARLLKRCNTKMAGHISPFLWVLWRTHLGWTGAGVLLSRKGIGATPSRSHLTGRRGLLTRMASRLALQAQAAAQRLTNHYKRQRPPSARRSKPPVSPLTGDLRLAHPDPFGIAAVKQYKRKLAHVSASSGLSRFWRLGLWCGIQK